MTVDAQERGKRQGAKLLMISCSLAVGVLTYFLLREKVRIGFLTTMRGHPFWTAAIVVASIAAAYLYPIMAASAVNRIDEIRRWAREDEEPVRQSTRIYQGAFWPATLPVSIIVYLFLGLINRHFQVDKGDF